MSRLVGLPASNCHTHMYSGLAPLGLPAPDTKPENFLQILERVWWRLDRALDEASLRASARYYVAESLLAGTAMLIDHHESPSFIEGSLDILGDACQDLGMRALICYGATERNGGREEAKRGLEECRRFHLANERALVRSAVALHASFTVSDETIAEAGDLCRQLRTMMHVHVAEDLADVHDAVERGYRGPLERLLRFDALPAGSIVAHGVHLDGRQMKLASDSRLWVVQNPRSNRGNGVGYPRAMAAAARVALGTDGFPSCMKDEEAALRSEAEEHHEPPDEIERRVNGGRSLIRELFGQIDDVAIHEDGRLVSMVVGGREVIADGRLVGGDIDDIRAHADEAAASLWKRMADIV